MIEMLVEEEFMRELGVSPEEWRRIKNILATGMTRGFYMFHEQYLVGR